MTKETKQKCVLCGEEVNAPGMKSPCHGECMNTLHNSFNQADLISMAENLSGKGQDNSIATGTNKVAQLKRLALVNFGFNYDTNEITFPGSKKVKKIKELLKNDMIKNETEKWS